MIVPTRPGTEFLDVLVGAFVHARRQGARRLGTQHLLHAALAHEPVPGVRVRGGAWLSPDDAPVLAPDPIADGALHEARWRATRRPPLPPQPSEAARAAVRRALEIAAGYSLTWAAPAHLLLGLLSAPQSRAVEALRRVAADRDEVHGLLTVRPSARVNGSPACLGATVLRDGGALDRAPRLFYRWLTRQTSAPVLAVLTETRLQTIRGGRAETTGGDLLAAMLVLDEQLAGLGVRWRPEIARHNQAGSRLRAAGVCPELVTEPVILERITMRARLTAGDEGVRAGTGHLLDSLRVELDVPDLSRWAQRPRSRAPHPAPAGPAGAGAAGSPCAPRPRHPASGSPHPVPGR
ncbi:hypothetical protein JOF53_001533 [Crossiella equi]|uniref:Clp amino terminal domain n=1 Tax=Crossiella equi TaxID=130796 RepID=A0ABS5A7V9_9PSEU|nr:hypothetical protein [Crossiella equi]